MTSTDGTAATPGAVVTCDLVVVGAGPTGLFATYYAGFRGLRVALVDSLPELGGQVTAMYPEKLILDVAGFPAVRGRDLVSALVEQAAGADAVHLLGRTASTLVHGEDEVVVGLDDGTQVHAGAVLVTAGIGRFAPRPLAAGEGWLGRGLEFFVPTSEPYAGRDVVVVGGGDSALDWVLHLEPVARSVTLVHRRTAFRAHERTVAQVRASSARVLTDAEVVALRPVAGEAGRPLAEVDVARGEARAGTREVLTLPCQAVVAALGFVADLGPLQGWGLDVERRHVVVDAAMRTSLPRVFAAGDVAEHPGKVRLIATGFGEAATAVNNAAVVIDPAASTFPGHSSALG
ncbi:MULTISPECIES: NAD(P)/FAD-dependent oxidoreductase [unclassified Nocardioides]|uniref:NAD(P)/FAD-dependent oxidoreductase n=1 Tax=unclassified Nocardioides TaxID=2615069 RepID=UPI0009E7BCEE|nr:MULTISPECIES: NAD(P)/FAD-dependent oxidoreductase [unclassified Nocardioides]MCM3515412.1 NAD(P)/FAD-dependent oxidoreductase [Nocardioides sp. P86]